MVKAVTRFVVQYQHLILLLLTAFLIMTSGWVVLGRSLRANASIWDLCHVYLGLVSSVFAISFFITNLAKGKWRQYYPWLILDFSQIKQDLVGLPKGEIPVAGGKGIFSLVEGLGMLLLLGVSITGVLWFVFQGEPVALEWRSYHQLFAKGFIIFILIHIVFACLHLLDFIRD